MNEEVDFKQVAASLQSENEQLRIHILKMRNTVNPFQAFQPDSMRSFLIRNYIVIASLSCLFLIVASLVGTIRGLFKDS